MLIKESTRGSRFCALGIGYAEVTAGDATVATVYQHLLKPRPYVTGILKGLRACFRAHGSAGVRIGMTGTGKSPYYRIAYSGVDGQEIIEGSFYDNHQPFENNPIAETSGWSSEVMTYYQFERFVGSVTPGYSGPYFAPPDASISE